MRHELRHPRRAGGLSDNRNVPLRPKRRWCLGTSRARTVDRLRVDIDAADSVERNSHAIASRCVSDDCIRSQPFEHDLHRTRLVPCRYQSRNDAQSRQGASQENDVEVVLLADRHGLATADPLGVQPSSQILNQDCQVVVAGFQADRWTDIQRLGKEYPCGAVRFGCPLRQFRQTSASRRKRSLKRDSHTLPLTASGCESCRYEEDWRRTRDSPAYISQKVRAYGGELQSRLRRASCRPA